MAKSKMDQAADRSKRRGDRPRLAGRDGWLAAAALVIVLAAPGGTAAQAPAPSDPPAGSNDPLRDVDRWPLEQVRLNDGTVYRGLVEAEEPGRLIFAELVRAPGKRAGLLVHPVDRSQVADRTHLNPDQRDDLVRRLERLRNRAAIEAGRMESVQLVADERGGRRLYEYQGHWFALDSTADAETTRRCIVRLEQVFLAYRRLLPPRATPKTRLRVTLFGSVAEYRDHLQRAGLQIDNPAYFTPAGNQIVAGSDLTRFGIELSKAQASAVAARRRWEAEKEQLDTRLAELGRQLEAAGVPEDERRQERIAARKRFEQEMAESLKQIRASQRRNLARLDQFAEGMFARLSHEAFHAYVENFLYRHDDPAYQTPRWLNEGLAQVFERGVLDDDTLRIDAPDKQRLAELRAELRQGRWLPLADLLAAEQELFLFSHAGGDRASQRHYRSSWGLTYYLIFGPARFDRAAFELLSRRDLSPRARLEKLTGMPLETFERQWRAAVARGLPGGPE